MALIKCPECGKQVSDKSDKCIHCGFPLYLDTNGKIEKVKCPYCGTENPEHKKECVNCGAKLQTYTPEPRDEATDTAKSDIGKPKNKIVSLLLCIFLGYFGAHKFYEEKILIGVLYLLTFGLFGIGWIVDIVILATKRKTYYVSNKPMKKGMKCIVIALIALMIIGMFSEDEPNETLKETETTPIETLETEESETISLAQNQEIDVETIKEETTATAEETTTVEQTITAEEATTIAEETELSEEEYKAQCQELFYDEVFFGEENLEGQSVKLHLFLSESAYFTIDSLYSARFGEYMDKYELHRNLFECCVLREGEKSYVGQQISMWFSSHYDLDPSDYQTGDKVVVYADVINWSDNTWDGYNSVTIIPRYIEGEGN